MIAYLELPLAGEPASDPAGAAVRTLVYHRADGSALGQLWSTTLKWTCADRPLRVMIVAVEPCVLPRPAVGEPVVGALARLLAALRGSGGLLLLANPDQALGPERIAYAEGVRLLAIAAPADEQCWDAGLSLGLPLYGVCGRLRLDLSSAHPAAVMSALAYGMFVCEAGLSLSAFSEDRSGLSWQVAASAGMTPSADIARSGGTAQSPGTAPSAGTAQSAKAAVIVRGGFIVAEIPGLSGEYRDRGGEGYVRVVIQAEPGRVLTQPRLIAPRPAVKAVAVKDSSAQPSGGGTCGH